MWAYGRVPEKILKDNEVTRASPLLGNAESVSYGLFNMKKTLKVVVFQGRVILDRRVQRSLSQAVLRDAQWQRAQSKTLQSKNLPSEYQETFFCCHSDWAVTDLAEDACEVSFPTETQKLCGCGPWPPSFSGSAWGGEVGPVGLWPFPPHTDVILWLKAHLCKLRKHVWVAWHGKISILLYAREESCLPCKSQSSMNLQLFSSGGFISDCTEI